MIPAKLAKNIILMISKITIAIRNIRNKCRH